MKRELVCVLSIFGLWGGVALAHQGDPAAASLLVGLAYPMMRAGER
ncbi:hypothetical protein [Salinigranum halophilum]|nr:hypothetical protein [Salinigranum halophilum]